MFFNKPDILLFLDRNTLTVFEKGHSSRLDIPKQISSFLEILDKESYEKLLSEYLKSLGFENKKGVIVLAKDLVFTKKIDHTDSLAKDKESFFNKVPLKSEALAKASIDFGDYQGLFAANTEAFIPIVEQAAVNGLEITAVIPTVLFEGISTASDVDQQSFNKLLASSDDLKKVNFLNSQLTTVSPAESETQESTNKTSWYQGRKNILMLILVVILFSIATLFTLYALKIINLPFLASSQKPETASLPESSVAPVTDSMLESTKSAEVATSSAKTDLKVSVLNGTGVGGLAGKVKTELESIGFTRVETGNTNKTSGDQTLIKYKKTVSTQVAEELIKLLDKTFLVVQSQ